MVLQVLESWVQNPDALTKKQQADAGTYAFSVTAELPPVTPPQNHFSIIIRQQPTENVVDAAFGSLGAA